MLFSVISLLIALAVAQSRDTGTDRLAQQLSEANYAFSIDLYKQLVKPRENLVASGFSVSSVLAMLAEGSRGQSAKQLLTALRYDKLSRSGLEAAYRSLLASLKSADYDLVSANSVWVEKSFPILEEFAHKLTQVYEAETRSLDLATGKDDVNEWVKGKTENMIPKLLEENLSEDVVVLLLNAVYFKGIWETAFNNKTFEAGFLDQDDEIPMDDYSSATTRMMFTEGTFDYVNSKELGAEIVDIPYKGQDMSLTIVLPHWKLVNLEARLTEENLRRAIGQLKSTADMSIVMPVFEIESKLELKETLARLGVQEVFSSKADLSGINPTALLEVSSVVQKAKIEVNQVGTKAAAATVVEITNRSGRFHSVEFRATHPFMFLLRHRPSNTILFTGRYTECKPFSKDT